MGLVVRIGFREEEGEDMRNFRVGQRRTRKKKSEIGWKGWFQLKKKKRNEKRNKRQRRKKKMKKGRAMKKRKRNINKSFLPVSLFSHYFSLPCTASHIKKNQANLSNTPNFIYYCMIFYQHIIPSILTHPCDLFLLAAWLTLVMPTSSYPETENSMVKSRALGATAWTSGIHCFFSSEIEGRLLTC